MEVHIGLNESVLKQMAQNLSLLLSDTYVLYAKTQNFHWNVQDPRFTSLHLLFEKQYKELAEAIDEMAERIRILGEHAPGSMQQFLSRSSIQESKGDLSGDEMLQVLLTDHETLCRYIREQISLSAKLGDEGTADLLIQRLRSHEKSSWTLRSHMQ